MGNKDQIRLKALELLKNEPHGLRYSELRARIAEAFPNIPKNTISGTIWNLEVQLPQEISKPARGLYVHRIFLEPGLSGPLLTPPPVEEKIREERFYAPFADWLVEELEECTKAIPLGGKSFGDKWGTPDVIGVREPRKSDIIEFPTEIVAAEIKIDPSGLITAFGQACAYRLFSHKSYLVVPQEASEGDLARLDTLARIFGIGLILFDAKSPKAPSFQIRVRAAKHDPDMFYVNQSMKLVEERLFR